MISRFCMRINQAEGGAAEALPIEDFRDVGAYVLLGEPGMGKSTVFECEANQTGAMYHRKVSDFLTPEPNAQWKEKTHYIDGLDETRSEPGGGVEYLYKIRKRLEALGRPKFRLACREADWYGSEDRLDLGKHSADQKLEVLRLQPLGKAEQKALLKEFSVENPADFILHAEKHGLGELLGVPFALKACAKICKKKWPESKQELYDLFCEELLAEHSYEHQNLMRKASPSREHLQCAAEELCAVLMLANLEGFALIKNAETEYYPSVEEFSWKNNDAVRLALGRNIFRASNTENQRQPLHRIVAEYLAAKHLVKRFEVGLPLSRIQALMTNDGEVKKYVRGVHAWLATLCPKIRKELIQDDPLGILLYGDVGIFSAAERIEIIKMLGRKIKDDLNYVRDQYQYSSSRSFGVLATEDLRNEFKDIFCSAKRDEEHQAILEIILLALRNARAGVGLDAKLFAKIIRDTNYLEIVRCSALRALIHQHPKEKKVCLELFNDLLSGVIVDEYEELLGILLPHLCKNGLAINDLAKSFHVPKRSDFTGMYHLFWCTKVIKTLTKENRIALLEEILQRPDLFVEGHYFLRDVIGNILASVVEESGQKTDAARLYSWLRLARNENEFFEIEHERKKRIQAWLSKHPDIHKDLIRYGLLTANSKEDPSDAMYGVWRNLHNTKNPEDFLEWLASEASQHGKDSIFARLYSTMNSKPEIPKLQKEQEERARLASKKKEESLLKIRTNFHENEELFKAGKAPVNFLNYIAMSYRGDSREVSAKNPEARLLEILQSQEAVNIAIAALENSFAHPQLPSVKEAVSFAHQVKHHLCEPCLIAMERFSHQQIDELGTEKIKVALAFYFAYGVRVRSPWYERVVERYPEWAAEVAKEHLLKELKSDSNYIPKLLHDLSEESHKTMAQICVPYVLQKIPSRPKKVILRELQLLLHAGFKHLSDAGLARIVGERLAQKNIEEKQLVCWLAAALALKKKKYTRNVFDHIAASQARAILFAECIDAFGRSISLSLDEQKLFIELVAPHVLTKRADGEDSGWGNPFGLTYKILSMIRELSSFPSGKVAKIFEDLRKNTQLRAWECELISAQKLQAKRMREEGFKPPSGRDVIETLANRAPANHADFSAYILEILAKIEKDIQGSENNVFRQFWSYEREGNGPVVNKKPKSENDCRDVLKGLIEGEMKAEVKMLVEKEAACIQEKRVDLRISFNSGKMVLPIEIKPDWNQDLWHAHKKQLPHYTKDPATAGYGIYLVLWFGVKKPPTNPRGQQPKTPAELRSALAESLSPEALLRTKIVVMDCSWLVA